MPNQSDFPKATSATHYQIIKGRRPKRRPIDIDLGAVRSSLEESVLVAVGKLGRYKSGTGRLSAGFNSSEHSDKACAIRKLDGRGDWI
jgi:hypothetical protein